MNSTSVAFSIIPGGTVNPVSDTSDKNGQVKTKVVLGADSGTYIITVTANGASAKATVIANSGG